MTDQPNLQAEVESLRLEAEKKKLKAELERPADPKEPANFAGDKVGAGRYILAFCMANFLGLWIAYWARYYGWRCIWICAIILAVVVAYFVGVSQATHTCYSPNGVKYSC